MKSINMKKVQQMKTMTDEERYKFKLGSLQLREQMAELCWQLKRIADKK